MSKLNEAFALFGINSSYSPTLKKPEGVTLAERIEDAEKALGLPPMEPTEPEGATDGN